MCINLFKHYQKLTAPNNRQDSDVPCAGEHTEILQAFSFSKISHVSLDFFSVILKYFAIPVT